MANRMLYRRRILCPDKLDVDAINFDTTKAVAGFEVVRQWSFAAARSAEDQDDARHNEGIVSAKGTDSLIV